MAHVLAVTPHNRLEPETIRSLFTQTYAGPLSHVFMRDNPESVPGLNIVRAYRRLREIFLAGPYDMLWIVENDLIVPPEALERLLSVGADIAYGCYCFRRGRPVVNIMQPRSRNPLTGDPAAFKRAWGHVVDCGGLGFGCTLIARHVLERFEMRSEGGGGDCDTCLANDAAAAGMVQRAHLGVICGHKRPDGVTIWPTATRPFFQTFGKSVPRLATVRALRGFAVWSERGVPTIVGQGQDAPIDFEVAQSLVGAGQAEYVQ